MKIFKDPSARHTQPDGEVQLPVGVIEPHSYHSFGFRGGNEQFFAEWKILQGHP